MAKFRRVLKFSHLIDKHFEYKKGISRFRDQYMDLGGSRSYFEKNLKKLKKKNRKLYRKKIKNPRAVKWTHSFSSGRKPKGHWDRLRINKMDALISKAGRTQQYMDKLSYRMGGARKNMKELKYLERLFKKYRDKKPKWWTI